MEYMEYVQWIYMINEALKASRELHSFNNYISSGYATKRIFSLDVASAILYVPNKSCRNWNFLVCKQFILPQ